MRRALNLWRFLPVFALTHRVAAVFYSQLHRCPLPCDVSGPSSGNWTTYHSVERLAACNDTMLLDFNIHTPISDPETHTTIRACSQSPALALTNASCSPTDTTTIDVGMRIIRDAGPDSDSSDSLAASIALQNRLSQNPACGTTPTIAIAYSSSTVIGIYAGAQIRDPSSVLNAFVDELRDGAIGASVLVQSCASDERGADFAIGVVATSGPSALARVQSSLASWANGTCTTDLGSGSPWKNFSLSVPALADSDASMLHRRLSARATCSTAQVASGDSCASLATKCNISPADFTKFNPSPTLCSTLQPGELVCCSSGTLPDLSPKPSPNGTCATHTVVSGDSCSAIAAANSITTAEIEARNNNTWGYMGCADLQIGQTICLSTGSPPMPAPVANTICGPQVPGTAIPANISVAGALASLNPCVLNACCDVWGQCGVTSDFCTISKSSTGAPGTAAPGQNGCISNCGTSILKSAAPASPFTIGYFEGFNMDRACLNLDASQISAVTAASNVQYTHLHFAFSNISSNWDLGLEGSTAAQWELFRTISDGPKIVLSFGGWSFSTAQDSYPIFRDVVTAADRSTFIANIVEFVAEWDIAGVDFDWEYPGATDIPGVPGSPGEGANYLAFLKQLRAALPADKSISVAVPASYWYLKGFPISDMAKVVDYFVLMAYDFHGPWDYDNAFSQEGCPLGNCLRSHINYTETLTALSMITKAGAPSNKIVVGVASYGRSFKMTTPGCTGPMCTYTGPLDAEPGPCTATSGYLANAEINDIINGNQSVSTFYDADSDSNILVYNSTQWVAYMEDFTKFTRTSKYLALNFLGTVDWAIDLQYFVDEETYQPLPSCDDADQYTTIDEIIADTSIPDNCVNMYTLNVLAETMQAALQNYSSIMADSYTDKYNAYVTQVKRTAPVQWDAFYNAEFDNLFTCLYAVSTDGGKTYQNQSNGCPPNNLPYAGQAWNTFAIPISGNMSAFYDAIADYGIDSSWVVNSSIELAPCLEDCDEWGKYYLPQLSPNFSVPDPGGMITQALANYTGLADWLSDSAFNSELDYLLAENSDAVDGASTAVFTTVGAVNAMQQVADIGEKAEEEEVKELILAFISALLLIIPGLGEALDAVTDIAIFGRMAALVGDVGNGALTLYDVASDPSSAPMAILGALLGGVAARDDSVWADAAKVRRGMADDVLESLGEDVAANMKKVSGVDKHCSI